MNLRAKLLDILDTPPYGKLFDDLMYELDVSTAQLEALLTNLRRNKIVKPYEGKWYLQHQPILEAVRVQHAKKKKTDDGLGVEIKDLRRQVKQNGAALRRFRAAVDRMAQDFRLLETELAAIEQRAGSDS